jgi:hypothetical protein
MCTLVRLPERPSSSFDAKQPPPPHVQRLSWFVTPFALGHLAAKDQPTGFGVETADRASVP